MGNLCSAPPARGVCNCAGSPIQGVPTPRLPARGACTCAGPPTKACAGAAPPRKGSVHLRRFAHHSVCRRRASPRGERALRRFAYPRCAGARLPARGVCTCAGPPTRACAGARLSARGVCDRAGPPSRARAGARLHRAECAQNTPRFASRPFTQPLARVGGRALRSREWGESGARRLLQSPRFGLPARNPGKGTPAHVEDSRHRNSRHRLPHS